MAKATAEAKAARQLADLTISIDRYAPWLLLCCALPLFFYKLGAIGFLGPDEPRYAQVAREMYQRGDWVTPTLLGDTWFEKPALLYWLIIACYKLLGVNEFAARLPNALMATGNLFIIYQLARRAGKAVYGLACAMVLATSALYFGLARAASFDLPLTFTFTLALGCFHLADTSSSRSERRNYLGCFYAAIGLSLLAKGLVGIVLIGAIIFCYQIITGRWRELWRLNPISGLVICLLVAASWYGPVIARHGWLFINEFFVQHHFQRFTSNRYHHPGPIYYFVLIIIAGMLPWSLFLLAMLYRAVRKAISQREQALAWLRSDQTEARLMILAICWTVVPLIFFSLSNSKLPGYILPVFPALALIVGKEIKTIFLQQNSGQGIFIATAVLLLVLGLALPHFANKELHLNPLGQVLIAALPILIALGLLLTCGWHRERFALGAVAAFSPILAIMITTLLFPAIENQASLTPLARLAATNLQPQEQLIFFNYQQYTPFFYTNGRIVPGEKGEAARPDNSDELIQYLSRYPQLLCVVRQRQLNQITNNARLESSVIGSQRDIMLVRVSLRKPSD